MWIEYTQIFSNVANLLASILDVQKLNLPLLSNMYYFSSVPEWESSINDDTGELLYIDCVPCVTSNNADATAKPMIDSRKSQSRQSTRSKFLRLIRRRESKRRSKRNQGSHNAADLSCSNKVKFQDCHEGEEREVVVKLKRENYQKMGRRTSLIESVLGLCVSTLSDGSRIMIAGFTPDSAAKTEKCIKIGDWLKSINHLNVFFDNLDSVIEQVKDESHVTLKLQRVAGIEVTKVPPANELSSHSKFVQQLVNNKLDDRITKIVSDRLCGVMYLNTDCLTENGDECKAVEYCFPHSAESNVLYNSKGVYITLNHLLVDLMKEAPRTTTFLSNNSEIHVVYTGFEGNKLLLFMFPGTVSKEEAILINDEVIRFLKFTYQTLNRCFESDNSQSECDCYFTRLFLRILKLERCLYNQESIRPDNGECCPETHVQFEEILPAAVFLLLPKEVELQIDDALTELEASDYREWVSGLLSFC